MSAGELLRAAYPLTWPDHQPRTAPETRRTSALFKASFGKARDELMAELGRLHARHVVLSTNIPLRRDGLPYADARQPEDPGVAVYFERLRQPAWLPFVIACDVYSKVEWNLRAVGLTIESLRAIERHGSTSMMEQAFTGYSALPQHTTPPESWRVVLGFGLSQHPSPEALRARHREMAKTHHPDVGGSPDEMARINHAYDRAREELGG